MALTKVMTKYGWVQGMPSGNQSISVFKGIPYAKPPIGDLRWKRPVECDPWEGVLEAYRFPKICPQFQVRNAGPRPAPQGRPPMRRGDGDMMRFIQENNPIQQEMDEDCLYLSLWTPANEAGEKLPVAVWLHGGGYGAGYGHGNAYDGEGFAKRGVITVILNHRLGVFGYLAHPDLAAEDAEGSTGNYGTWDMIMALTWVRDNIAAFGGDPDNVSVFGQSGGGWKVEDMLVSPKAYGLVRRGVMQSGGGLNYTRNMVDKDTAYAASADLFKNLGISTVEEARAIAPDDLINAVSATPKMGVGYTLGPMADGVVFPDLREKMILEGSYPDLDLMIGSCSEESYDTDAEMPSKEQVRADAAAMFGEENADRFMDLIDYDNDPDGVLEIYRNRMSGFGTFLPGTVAFCENQIRLGKKPVYEFIFDVVPVGMHHCHHNFDHHYVFQTLLRSPRRYEGKDLDLSNIVADYWANFFKTGDPNGEGLPEWKPRTADNAQIMGITYGPHMTDIPKDAFMELSVERSLKEWK